MGTSIIVIFCIIGIAAAFFLEALWLWVTTKIFKVKGTTYKKALKISTIFLIVSMILQPIIIGALFALGHELIGIAIAIFVVFFVANFLYKKYYLTGTKKNIGIYIVKSFFSGVAGPIAMLTFIIIPIRMYVMQPFFIQGDSMNPNFKNNHYLILNEFDRNYKRGDVVVFRYSKDPKTFFIKRVIGLPGEIVQIKENSVFINGQKLDESGYIGNDIKTIGRDYSNITLGNNEYFMLADNREKGFDSRSYGPVEKDLITGKYWFSPFGNLGE